MRSEPPTGDELNRMLVSMKQQVLEQAAKDPAPAARSRTINRGLALGVGVTLFLGLGATAAYAITVAASQEPQAAPPAQTFTPPASPTATPAPTPTPPTPEFDVTPGQPASRYGLDCETLVDQSFVQALFTVPVAASDPIVTGSRGTMWVPIGTSVMSLGGTVCEWSDGTGYRALISVTPRPITGWDDRAVAYQTGQYASQNGCEWQNSCRSSATVNDAWVTMSAVGPDESMLNTEQWPAFREAALATVGAAGPAEPPTSAENSDFAYATRCEDVLSLERLRVTLSDPRIEYEASEFGLQWPDWQQAKHTAGDFECSWHPGPDLPLSARTAMVEGGRWAYLRMLEAGTADPVHLSGLAPGDEAVVRCDEVYAAAHDVLDVDCAVDLALGGDWYNVGAADADTAVALAEALLAQRTQAAIE